MREIKFRAWEKDKREIISVYDIDFKTKMINIRTGAWRTFYEIELMQYTGLKDEKGKEVYEGDVIIDHNGKGIIECIDSVASFRVNYKNGEAKWFIDYMEFDGWIEVVGNIYENPELMESIINGKYRRNSE